MRPEPERPESNDPIRTWEGHRRIVEALERQDAVGAQQAVVAHFAGTREQLLQAGAWTGTRVSATCRLTWRGTRCSPWQR